MIIILSVYILIINQVFTSDVVVSNNIAENNSSRSDFMSLSNNTVLPNEIKNMTRITQISTPSQVQSILNVAESSKNSGGSSQMKEFKPSPIVETYEHNKVRVKPAIPEAKAFNDVNYNDYRKPLPNHRDQSVWKDHSGSIDWKPGDTWSNNVKFPTNNDDSFKYNSFLDDRGNNNYLSEDLAFKKPISFPSSKPADEYTVNRSPDYPRKSLSDSYGPPIPNDLRPPQQKTFGDYNLMEKPQYYEEEVLYPSYGSPYENGRPHKIPGYVVYSEDHGGGYGGMNTGNYKTPWKKIIKFLATIIPIGLLISALTPNVINIQNNTEPEQYGYKTKYRNEDSSYNFSERLSSSLNYFNKLNEDGCEDKVLCELLLSASFSKNAEEYVKTLLDNFVRQEDLQNKKDDLLKIFDAVKKEDCSPIQCENKKNPT